eukprot:TRINITY_DN1051_c0_g1_i1.p1 TRINITY_DN1051_c0_g1~~TRINITY_DN1051_c0_g1_i1.p1  ORF type:complete len:212 (-),score=17.42 TRINITY_DN1051_c0_g1_i1:301-936(-)
MASSDVLQQFQSRLQLPSAFCNSGNTLSGSLLSAFSNAVFRTGNVTFAASNQRSVARPTTADGLKLSPLAPPGFNNWRISQRNGLKSVMCGSIGNNVESTVLFAPVQERQAVTLYDILGVSSEATDMDLKVAFRCMAKKYHPDRAPPEAVSEYQKKFLELRRAYDVLKDQRSRAIYDFEIKNSPKFWARKFDAKHRQWRGRNWETDQCWTS